MILRYTQDHFISLYDFLKNNNCFDFYITQNNIRYFVQKPADLKCILKYTDSIYICEENREVLGIILLWKAIGNNVSRCYIKLNAKDENIARKLLTILLWHCNHDLYIKIRKNSPFIKIFREKKFNFIADRGNEILLRKLKSMNSSLVFEKKD